MAKGSVGAPMAEDSKLYPLTDICGHCGTGHLASPCRYPCICRCRKCNMPLRHNIGQRDKPAVTKGAANANR
jgi:hypothetical protein